MTDARDITERGQAIDWVESTLESNAHYEHGSEYLENFIKQVVTGIKAPMHDTNTLQAIVEALDDPKVEASEIVSEHSWVLLAEALDNYSVDQLINDALEKGVDAYRAHHVCSADVSEQMGTELMGHGRTDLVAGREVNMPREDD